MIAGSFYNSNGAAGFESEGSTYRMIIPRMTSDAAVWGISDSGYLVGNGTLKQQGTSVNFIFRHGIYSPITIPNAPKAVVFGINSAGTIAVGFYDLPSDYQVGFSYQNGVTLELNVSGALDTVALGVNNFGEVVGYFEDTDGITVHGFLWTPPAEAPKP
jgi:probable HAF family extracellular repeat protein